MFTVLGSTNSIEGKGYKTAYMLQNSVQCIGYRV